MKNIFLILMVMGIFGGCGGDIGSSSNHKNNTNNVITYADKTIKNAIRVLKPGDYIKYKYTDKIVYADKTTKDITGTIENKVFPKVTINGYEAYVMKNTATITADGVQLVFINDTFFSQNKDGTIFIFGHYDHNDNDYGYITTPEKGYVTSGYSPAQVGDISLMSYELSNSTDIVSSYNIIGTQNVSTPIGNYKVFKMTSAYTKHKIPTELLRYIKAKDNYVSSSTSYEIPDLGFSTVKEEGSGTYTAALLDVTRQNYTHTYSMEITETNISF